MEVQQDPAAPCARRCTIGPVIPIQEAAVAAATPMAGDGSGSPQRSLLLPLPVQEPGGAAERSLEVQIGAPEHAYQAPDEEVSSGEPNRETQQLFFWSAAPSLLGAPSATNTDGEGEATSQPASPSDALLHSLGDGGLRSAMRPPAFLPQHDWLRHLLVHSIEDAQLLFSSLWDQCTCSTLGLPSKTYQDNPSAAALDPVIAFAACAPSAPKRRLSRRGNEAHADADEANPVPASSKWDLPDDQEHGEGGQDVEAQDRPAAAVESDGNGRARTPPTAREYISAVMSWATRQLDDQHLFPPSPTTAGSLQSGLRADNSDEALVPVASLIVRRLLRCYAHVYLWHLPLLQHHGAVAHANRCLKRLLFLAEDAQLLHGNEGPIEPLRSLADAWLRHEPPQTSEHPAAAAIQASTDAAAGSAGEPTNEDWLLPALHKAELCLGPLDNEEYPFFGAEQSAAGEDTSSELPDQGSLYI